MFCPHCGAAQSEAAPEREKVVVVHTSSSTGESIAGAVALIVIVGGFLIFAGTIEVFDCPNCNNSPLLRWACPYCGGDGKVTLFQLIAYSLRSSLTRSIELF
jgi:rRNA maturation protein Nop10